MKCAEITDALIEALRSGKYKYLRCNFPNGDMVGHTGSFAATRCSMEALDLQLARILKANPATASVPVIFCTAKDSEDDMVHGLELGADDYITKPYTLRNVLARVRTVLRRTAGSATQSDESITFKGLTVLPHNKTCIVDGVEVKMPRKELEILLMLLSHPGHIFTRGQILSEIWPDEVVVLDRVVDVNITRIRNKIGPYGRHIVTRTGYGYGFME